MIGSELSNGRLVIRLVQDKYRGADKVDLGPGNVFDCGILCKIKRRRVTADIAKGCLVFLGRDSTTQYTTHNACVEGEV